MANDKKEYQKNVSVRKPDKSGSEILDEGLKAMAITYGTGVGAMVGLGGYATAKEAAKEIKKARKKEKDRKAFEDKIKADVRKRADDAMKKARKKEKDRKAFEDKIKADVRKRADDAMKKARKKYGLPPIGSDPKEFKIKGGAGPKGKRLKRI